jgi:glyoxylase-like metal-dependent hydrolase (beta-lactamase superfamily II)
MGRSLEDIRAVVLTHAHSDHIGFAERIRTERGVPIRVHELDELRAKGQATARPSMSPAARVIHIPGHTEGSAALHFVQRDVICVGDSFVTRNVINGGIGPQLFPNFNTDNELALASLARFDGVDARLVLAGHGAPWDRGLAEAVRLTRENWRTRTTTPAG